jgi:hypothetical protein
MKAINISKSFLPKIENARYSIEHSNAIPQKYKPKPPLG